MSVNYHYENFPPKIFQQDLEPQLGQARIELGRYDGLLAAIPNGDVLLGPLLQQEAVLSSRIEGTQSSLSEVLEYEGNEKSKKFSESEKADIHEIINYHKAIKVAIDMMGKRPLCLPIMLDAHKILMSGVRGASKAPGEFRKIQNWIGSPGDSIQDTRFVPISADKLLAALSAWENYIHADDGVDDIIKAAVLHAEFEAIHPFLDGNGRLGRMIIPLFLWEKKLIRKPHFYMSAYLEKHRSHYYDALLEVSKSGAWVAWCRFFITGIAEEAKSNSAKGERILHLYNDLKEKTPAMTKSQYGITALDYIFAKPRFSSSQFYANANIPQPTAHRLLSVFYRQGVLQCEVGRGRNPSFYTFTELLEVAES